MSETKNKEEQDTNNNAVVQKSRPLLELWRSNMTLLEFKILDMYLSRINSRDPQCMTVTFTKRELEQTLGISKINIDKLHDDLADLMSHTITLPHITEVDGRSVVKPEDYRNIRGYDIITLFSLASVRYDDRGMDNITLTCTDQAKKYFFNIENVGYIRYRLHSIMSIRSNYSYIMFMYIESNRFRGEWDEEVVSLRKLFKCENSPTYDRFKDFNKKILKRTQKDLEDRTDCCFDYSLIKNGRNVVRVHFKVRKLEDRLDSAGVEALPDYEMAVTLADVDKDSSFLYNRPWALLLRRLTNKVSPECVYDIEALMDRMPQICGKGDHDEDEKKNRYEYIRRKVEMIEYHDSMNPVKYKIAYLKKIIEQDICSMGDSTLVDIPDPFEIMDTIRNTGRDGD